MSSEFFLALHFLSLLLIVRKLRLSLLLSGLVLLIIGAIVLLAGHQAGRIRLVTGIDVNQVLRSRDTLALAYSVRLDSLQVRPVQPDYTLQVWKVDTTVTANHPGNVRSLVELVAQYPL